MNKSNKIKVEYGTVTVARTTNYVSLHVKDNADDAHVLLTDDMVVALVHALTEAAGGAIAQIWTVADVRTTLDGLNDNYAYDITLTDSECVEVLDSVADNFDANDGVCWDTLKEAIMDFVRWADTYPAPDAEDNNGK